MLVVGMPSLFERVVFVQGSRYSAFIGTYYVTVDYGAWGDSVRVPCHEALNVIFVSERRHNRRVTLAFQSVWV